MRGYVLLRELSGYSGRPQSKADGLAKGLWHTLVLQGIRAQRLTYVIWRLQMDEAASYEICLGSPLRNSHLRDFLPHP